MRLCTALLAAFLSACAAPRQADPALAAEANEPLICADKAQCDLYWQRAQIWIAQNSRYRVQAATDTVISTYSPARGDPDYGYQIIREPRAGGGARIIINGQCGNMFGCIQSPEQVAVSFKRYVKAP